MDETNGNGKINGGMLGTVYKILKEFGFAVVVAGALFWALCMKDMQVKDLTNKVIVTVENNTKAMTDLSAIVGRGR
jgi:hypothetical protein